MPYFNEAQLEASIQHHFACTIKWRILKNNELRNFLWVIQGDALTKSTKKATSIAIYLK